MSMLETVHKGKKARPPRIVIHGQHKVGKSSFAASSPKPIFIQTEDGLDNLDVESFPLATSYDDVINAITELYTAEHDYQTVVVDSLDWFEKLIHLRVCQDHDKASISEFGYAKGYIYALDYFQEFLLGLNALRDKGMGIICISHTEMVKVDSPITESYDHFQLKLHKKAGAMVSEWADIIGFANQNIYVKEGDEGFNQTKRRGIATGERFLYLDTNPAYMAGNRLGITKPVDLNWNAFVATMNEEKK